MIKTNFVSYSGDLFVSVERLKANLRVAHDLEYTLLEDLIKTATQYVEQHSGKSLQEKNLFDLSCQIYSTSIYKFKQFPVKNVVSVEYYNELNELTLIDESEYELSLDEDSASIAPVNLWPVMYEKKDALKITYVSGYPETIEPPKNLEQAVILLATHWYENRSAASLRMEDIPHGVIDLINLSKVGWY